MPAQRADRVDYSSLAPKAKPKTITLTPPQTAKAFPAASATKQVSSLKGLAEARVRAQHPHPVAEAVKQVSSPKGLVQARKAVEPKKGGGGSTLATILNVPAQIEAKGYQNLL